MESNDNSKLNSRVPGSPIKASTTEKLFIELFLHKLLLIFKMKAFIVLLSVISLVYGKTLAHPKHYSQRCVNMWDEGCINGQLGGSGGDDYYLNGGGFNPGKRCVNMWDEGCINGQLGGSGGDDYYLNGGGFNPGKRCANMWDEGCINGQLGGSGGDDYYLNGNGGFNPGKRSLNTLLQKLQNQHHFM